MSLLALKGVSKRYGEGARERVVLREVSLEVQSGELGAVWGMRRSGRSTLLRIAAGIEAPDAGVVCFEGRNLARERESALGAGIGYCQRMSRSAEAQTVLDEAIVGLLARGISPGLARTRARTALERTGSEECAGLRLGELAGGEAIRVALARTLALRPRLLVIDEPVKGVDLLERDEILLLLQSLAADGIGVLASVGDSTGLSGADRTFALGDGELRAGPTPELAPVVALRRSASQAAG
jgi:ABC-type multidrug transport system ATPase subunit